MPRLTTRLVQQLAATGDQFVWDDVVPGFGVRCRGLQKSYVLQYRVMGGRGSRQRRVTLGRVGTLSLGDARHLAQEYLRGVRYGQDPAATHQAAQRSPRVQDLAERYLREHADVKKKPRSAKMDHVNLRLHIIPRLGKQRLDTLSRPDIARLHHGMRETPVAANRVLALVSKMMALAEQSVLRPKGRSLSLASASRVPEYTTERPATIGTLTGAPLLALHQQHSVYRETFTPFTRAKRLTARNQQDVVVKEREPELVLPGGSVCSSKKVYLGICNLCEEEKAVGLPANLSFPSGLNAGAPRKELWRVASQA